MPATWTQAFVDRLPFAAAGQQFYRDPKTPGLLLVVGKRTKTFTLQRDLWRGPRGRRTLVRTLRMAIRDDKGEPITELKLARLRAGELRALIDRGVDPLRPNEVPSGELTLGAAWEEYRAELKRKKRAAGTISNHEYLKTKLGDLEHVPLAQVTTPKVTKLHQRITDGGNPYLANDVAATIQTVYGHAMLVHGSLPPPPLNRDQRNRLFNKETPRSTLLRPEDFPAFWAKTAKMSTAMRCYWRVLLLAGARRRTLSELKRKNVNFKDKLVYFAKDKTGPYYMPLSDHMIDLIKEAMKGIDSDYVFTSATDDSMPLQEPRRDDLGISPHDLRRTYKTVLCADCEVSQTHEHALLNHADEGMDKVYRNREVICRSEKLRIVQERITDRAMELISSKTDGATA
jgi:integrase